MKNNLLLEDITRISQIMGLKIITEGVEPQMVNIIRKLVKELPDLNFRKLFGDLGTEEQRAYDILKSNSRRSSSIIEDSVQKLLNVVNWGELAETIINNKLLGNIADTEIENLIKKVELGKLKKQEFDDIMSDYFKNYPHLNQYPQLTTKLEKIYGVKATKAEQTFNSSSGIPGTLKHSLYQASIKNLEGKTLKWWEKVLSSADRTIEDRSHALLDNLVNARRLRIKGDEKFLDDLLSKLKQGIDDAVNNGKQGKKVNKTFLQNIRTNVDVITQKYKYDEETFYSGLESLLSSKYPNNSNEIKELIKQVKSQNPFKSGRWGALTQFFDNTSSSNYLKNFGRLLFKGNRINTIKELLQQTVSLLTLGTPKTKAEWSSYTSRGYTGFKELLRDLWVANNIGMPLMLVTVKTILSELHILGFGNDKDTKNFIQTWWLEFKQDYDNWLNTGHFGEIELLKSDDVPIIKLPTNPFHSWGLDIWEKYQNAVYTTKKGEGLIDNARKEFEDVFSSMSEEELAKYPCYKKGVDKADNIRAILDCLKTNTKEKVDNVIDKITDSELGFKAWCLKNSKTFVEYNQNTGIGKTDEPMDYQWNGTNFIPF